MVQNIQIIEGKKITYIDAYKPENNKIRIAGYARVSSGLEDQLNSFTNQVGYYQKITKYHPEWELIDVYADDGASGTTFKRKGVQELLSLCGVKINCIIVKDFSRFGRNPIDNIEYLDIKFPSLGVRFISINDNYDSHSIENINATLNLDYAFKNFASGLYSKEQSEKVRKVKRSQMEKGVSLSYKLVYGLKRDENDKNNIIIDEIASVVIQRIFDMKLQGLTLRQIAIKLNEDEVPPPIMHYDKYYNNNMLTIKDKKYIWKVDSISKILKDERYKGSYVANKREELVGLGTSRKRPREEWIIIENTYPKIVSEEIFDKVQHLLRTNAKVQKKYNPNYVPTNLFKGLIVCDKCLTNLTKGGTKNEYYYCLTKKTSPNASCSNIRINKKVLLADIKKKIKRKISTLKSKNLKVSKYLETLKELDYDTIHLLIESIIVYDDNTYKVNWNLNNFVDSY